ncbi:hypothetical protein PTKIN_Ptkin10aG0035000 [Pterospermum kingtungense]
MARQVSRSGARDDEVWFRIRERFIKFSKYEFALVTGLRFGTSTFDPNGQHRPPLDGVYTTRVTKDATAKTVHGLWEKFKAGHYSDRGTNALKVAKVLFVYCILFGVETRKSSVDRWVWTLVEDTDAWEAFPWGKHTYQMLMHYIEILPVSAVEGRDSMSYHFYGFAMSLLVHALETLSPNIAEREGLRLLHIDDDLSHGIQYVAPQKPINLRSSTATLTQRGPDRGQKSKRSTTSMVGVSKRQKTVSAGAGDRGRTDADSEHQYVVHIEGTSHGLSRDSVDDSDTVHLDEVRMDSPQDIRHTEAGDSVPAPDYDNLVTRLIDGLRPLIRVEVDRAICNIRQEVDRAHRDLKGCLPRIIYTELSDFFRASNSGMHTSFGHRDVHRSFIPKMQSQMAFHRSPPGSHIQHDVKDEVGAAPSHVHHEASDGGAGREAVHILADVDSSQVAPIGKEHVTDVSTAPIDTGSAVPVDTPGLVPVFVTGAVQIPSIPPVTEGLCSPSAALMTTTIVVPSVTPVVGATTFESPSRSDVIRPVRRRVESCWIRSPFVNLKRKVVDLDFRNYLSYLNSGDLVRRNVGVEIPIGPDYFRNIEHPRFNLEDQHMDPYLAILHHAPAWADLVVDVVLRDAYAVLDSAFYHAGLWELRKDLTTHRGELRVHIPGKSQQLVQTDSHSCGPFGLYFITCLLRRRFARDNPEKYMQRPFRREITYAIYRYSETEDWLDPDVIEHYD